MAEKRKSAFLRATQEAQSTAPTVTSSPIPTVTPFSGETVEQQERKAVQKDKVSFYLNPEQRKKLDTLTVEFWQQNGRMLNRNDIVRHLIDQCDIRNLQGL